MTRLTGKFAFITGAGTGIGRACALEFARQGAAVSLAGRRREPLDAVAAEIHAAGGQAHVAPCDVTIRSEVERALAAAEQHFGRLTSILNNAGKLLVANAENTSEDDWHALLEANLTSAFLVSRAALPALRRAGGGSIINISSSSSGIVSMKQRVAYSSSKAGVIGLTHAMALDHAGEGIRVNVICPAMVETEMVQGLYAASPDPAAALRARMATIPIGRFGRSEDVAHLAVYLASDESSWMTGVALPLDGGLTAT
ncbi:MAG TPA: SDR family NAD(P)-dependent oxidoreductase [Candidatus Acidoferrales bacterium]|nr:SDR family NAD(P)-dependent oxidoreductase [Candidatus Acidoferrales bacterium]